MTWEGEGVGCGNVNQMSARWGPGFKSLHIAGRQKRTVASRQGSQMVDRKQDFLREMRGFHDREVEGNTFLHSHRRESIKSYIYYLAIHATFHLLLKLLNLITLTISDEYCKLEFWSSSCGRQPVDQFFLVSGSPLGPMTRFYPCPFVSDNCLFSFRVVRHL
jgi:hypothetical protein